MRRRRRRSSPDAGAARGDLLNTESTTCCAANIAPGLVHYESCVRVCMCVETVCTPKEKNEQFLLCCSKVLYLGKFTFCPGSCGRQGEILVHLVLSPNGSRSALTNLNDVRLTSEARMLEDETAFTGKCAVSFCPVGPISKLPELLLSCKKLDPQAIYCLHFLHGLDLRFQSIWSVVLNNSRTP